MTTPSARQVGMIHWRSCLAPDDRIDDFTARWEQAFGES
jgi:hypothetical protein